MREGEQREQWRHGNQSVVGDQDKREKRGVKKQVGEILDCKIALPPPLQTVLLMGLRDTVIEEVMC